MRSQNGGNLMKRQTIWWSIIYCAQLAGVLSVPFANVHSNGFALLVMTVCLLPGYLLAGLWFHTAVSWTAVSVITNLVFWYVIFSLASRIRQYRNMKRAGQAMQ